MATHDDAAAGEQFDYERYDDCGQAVWKERVEEGHDGVFTAEGAEEGERCAEDWFCLRPLC
jgi:hypothetical protein